MSQLSFYSSLQEVRAAAVDCQGCSRASERARVVFGAGNPKASLMLVGEYPSQTDDRTGSPFTGPAGSMLDELLEDAGLRRDDFWITNLVRCYATINDKNGTRIRPARAREQAACRLWLDLEIQFVDPAVLVAIGAPAAAALIGQEFRLSDERGSWFPGSDGRMITATLQPAYLMRIESHDPGEAKQVRQFIVDDLRAASERARAMSTTRRDSG